ncbi:MAG: hypothetical protein ACJAUC_003297, partial [Planctomycetota bacterium]
RFAVALRNGVDEGRLPAALPTDVVDTRVIPGLFDGPFFAGPFFAGPFLAAPVLAVPLLAGLLLAGPLLATTFLLATFLVTTLPVPAFLVAGPERAKRCPGLRSS